MAKPKGNGISGNVAKFSAPKDSYWQWDHWKWGCHRVNCGHGDCPVRVYVKDGKVVREEIACIYPELSDPDNRVPDYNPRGCQKGYQHSRAMYGADRLLYPMKRKGERGSGQWERIGWEQAYDQIGSKVAEVIQKCGPQALLDDHGNNGGALLRGAGESTMTALMALLGGVSYDFWLAVGDTNSGQHLTLGEAGQYQQVGVETWFLADTIFVVSNPVYTNIPDYHYVLEARYRGAKVVSIAPDKNPTAQFADIWLPINWSADPALWLGVCRILIDNGWTDTKFIKEQTDLPVLVRKDNGRFLREADLREGGNVEQFYVINAASGQLAPLPKDTLRMSFDYLLEGTLKTHSKDGREIEATTVFTLFKERLSAYTPEKVHEIAGIHPDLLKRIAELCRPPRKVFVFSGWGAGKLYHGDLQERSYCYMLALTGNFGKPGVGSQGFGIGTEFSCSMPTVPALPKELLESDDPMMESVNLFQKMTEDYKTHFKMDPTMPDMEAASGALREATKAGGTLAPPAFLWYYHAGYKDVWEKHLQDPNAPRTISEYAEEAIAQGWWKGYDRPARDITPKVMFVSGGNPLRRHRGGMNTYRKTMWPKLELIVTVDGRWSTTGLFSDYILPAAQSYEYAETKMSTCDTRLVAFTDQSVPMQGESKSDRQIVLGILRSVQAHLKKLGIDKYKAGDREVVVDELYWRATYGNRYDESNEDEERLLGDLYSTMGRMGWYTSLDGEEMDLASMRKHGLCWLSGRPAFYAMTAQGADLTPGEIHYPLRDQVERGVPYVTTTRRIEFYLDHPWFIEADEQLARYKEPPYIAGRQHPLRLTGGHVRWSIHGNYHASEEMLKLHRGEPFAFINAAVAAEKGVEDNDYIRVFNDYGEFSVRAKPSPCVRPDQLVIYHAWEPYQYSNWMPYDGLLPGPPKGLHFAGGYRHYEYTLWSWGPQQADKQTSVSFEKAGFQG